MRFDEADHQAYRPPVRRPVTPGRGTVLRPPTGGNTPYDARHPAGGSGTDRAGAAARARSQGPVYEVKAEFFKVLGHPVRVRIIELLRDGERSVGALQGALGLDSSGTSQHLAALRKQGVVVGRRDGTSVYYSVRDPLVFQLLEVARRILFSGLTETTALLSELAELDEAAPQPARPAG